MLGRPGISEPVQNEVLPGSWLIALVLNECTRQRSSARFERCGNSSLIHTPFFPACANLNIVGATNCCRPRVMVVTRWPLLMDLGSSFLKSLCRSGL